MQQIVTTYIILNGSVDIDGFCCMLSTIPPKHRYVIADCRKYEEIPECLNLYKKIWLKQQEPQGDTNADREANF